MPGRTYLLAAGLVVLLTVLQQFVELPAWLDLVRKVVLLGCLAVFGWIVVLGLARRRQFLWRVRSKLILSYVFLALVPVVLIIAFQVVTAALAYMTLASYVFHEGVSGAAENVRQVAETSAIELAADPPATAAILSRKYASASLRYPDLSLAVIDGRRIAAPAAPLSAAGPWRHVPVPTSAPAWLSGVGGPFSGLLVYVDANTNQNRLLLRSVAPVAGSSRLVVADLPLDDDFVRRLDDGTGTRVEQIVATGCGTGTPSIDTRPRGIWTIFREAVAFMECVSWTDGTHGGVAVSLHAPAGGLYSRLASVESGPAAAAMGGSWTVFIQLLVMLAVLFLIVQGAAVVIGGLLARSITSAVHELFVGTERVQQGDFSHRIPINSRDQLGDLADSFNRMSGSVERLLQVQREKQRLDEELRIAREIQKSLLPVRPPMLLGLDIADMCEPAREVGGDYYDFFDLGPRQVGVLIADVSGKGTSAALYMAELKGLMLGLSQTERSPRRLLIEVNRLLAGHLDNRSFITMTYAIVDLEAMTMTSARAGHTPLMVASASGTEVVMTGGMVLGLRLPNADRMFEDLLVETCRPIVAGDAIVLYTDGITEAMDAAGELFGDSNLARVLAAQHGLDACGIRERVLRDVKAFVGEAEQHDDMTMVILKIGQPTEAPGTRA